MKSEGDENGGCPAWGQCGELPPEPRLPHFWLRRAVLFVVQCQYVMGASERGYGLG
jgi:hypothetical protein